MIVNYKAQIISNHIKEVGQLLYNTKLDGKESITNKKVIDKLADMVKSYKNIREIINYTRWGINKKEYK